MKIKDKLIHLLGGHTKEEFMIASRPITVKQYEREIATLKAKFVIKNPLDVPYPSWVKEELMRQLSKTIIAENLVTFVSKDISRTDAGIEPPEVSAYIDIVRPRDM